MEKEELKQRMRELDEKVQNDFIDKILEDIVFLSEKAIRKDYKPTLHELEVIEYISNYVDGIKKFFKEV